MTIKGNDLAGNVLTGAAELHQVLNGGELPLPTGPLHSRRISVLIFMLAFTVSAAYALTHIKVGWVPGDDGLLAQSALRVLQGQLPHRAFLEGYTGGLSFLQAAAFRVWGTNLAAMRWTVFLGFLAWLPAVFYVASRFTSATPA